MRGWLGLGVVLWATIAEATVFVADRGAFAALATQAASADSVSCQGAARITFLYDTSSGTFTANIQQSIDNGANWTDVASSSSSTDLALVEIEHPNGLYRPELSACSSCSVVTTWRCADQR